MDFTWSSVSPSCSRIAERSIGATRRATWASLGIAPLARMTRPLRTPATGHFV